LQDFHSLFPFVLLLPGLMLIRMATERVTWPE
jgi:hypothetical protein